MGKGGIGRPARRNEAVGAKNAARRLPGVTDLARLLTLRTARHAEGPKERIEKAFGRQAEIEADGIRVTVPGGKTVLEGRVKAW